MTYAFAVPIRVVVVSEGIESDLIFQAIMADPRTEFDSWYRDRMSDISDVPGGTNEVVGSHQA